MTGVIVSLLERHLTELRQALLRNDGAEHSAYVLFGNATLNFCETNPTTRLFISHSVEQVPDEAVLVSSPWQISWKTTDVIRALKNASTKKLTLGIAHNHTIDHPNFSHVDNENEAQLIQTIQNRNGPDALLISLLLIGKNKWRARLWTSPSECLEADEKRTIGDRFLVEGPNPNSAADNPIFHRQMLALGSSFNQHLRTLRTTVVGCGGTGSAVAMLLARLGVGTIALVDDDIVEETNLNRLHGATLKEAREKRAKVNVVSEAVSSLGLGTRVIVHKGWVADVPCRNVLKSSHVVFGCTDDNSGRILLNRFAYAYQIPVIDLGLAIQLSKDNRPSIEAMDGRVTVLIPGEACLLCRGVVDPQRASEEALKRSNPAEYERRKQEAYVIGEQNPSPAVVTFTTELACMAVNELIQRLQGFRGDGGSTANRTRLFHRMIDLRPSRNPDPECRVCGRSTDWCRGDTEPFLGIVG